MAHRILASIVFARAELGTVTTSELKILYLMTEGHTKVDFASFIVHRLQQVKNTTNHSIGCGGLVTFLSKIKNVPDPESNGYRPLPRGYLIDLPNITQAEYIRHYRDVIVWKLQKQDYLILAEQDQEKLQLANPIRETQWRLMNEITKSWPPEPMEANVRVSVDEHGHEMHEIESPPRGPDASTSGHPHYTPYSEFQASREAEQKNWHDYWQREAAKYNYEVAKRDYTLQRDANLFAYEHAQYDMNAQTLQAVTVNRPPRDDGRVYRQYPPPPTYEPDQCPPPFFHNPYPAYYPPDHYSAYPEYQPTPQMEYPMPPQIPPQYQHYQQQNPDPQPPNPFEELWNSFQR